MATIEQRVQRLENFMGNIDKITSVYANTVEEICNRWLNILYIESPEHLDERPYVLTIHGFLSDLTDVAALPHNTMFFVRPSHDFTYTIDHPEGAILRLTNGETTIELSLRKYKFVDPENIGELSNELLHLESGDYLAGVTYMFYINDQGIAVLSSSNAGSQALSLVQQLQTSVNELRDTVDNLGNSQTIVNLTSTSADIGTLTIREALTFDGAGTVNLPTGSTITGDPTLPTHITNKAYVDQKIQAELMAWHNKYHLFDVIDAQNKLSPSSVPEGAVYFKYTQ